MKTLNKLQSRIAYHQWAKFTTPNLTFEPTLVSACVVHGINGRETLKRYLSVSHRKVRSRNTELSHLMSAITGSAPL
jgi:hypothetical protein